ncbi:hypothetical protein L6Q96_04405 [Candidatus Binatia bacterium]|nr:hypothetical protein [Candidatus Binatia bacterium]
MQPGRGAHRAGVAVLALGAALFGAASAHAQAVSPPVIMELGPVVPPPAPTPHPAERKRIVSVITVQNSREGESVISFEASDFADEGDGKTRPLASRTYSLVDDEEPKGKELRAKILRDIRKLERDMLDYAKIIGPPKERAPLGPGQSSSGGQRPYR